MIELRKYLIEPHEAKIIFQRMKDMKLSERQLSEKLNINGHSCIGYYIRGQYLISEHILNDMLAILGLSFEVKHDMTLSEKHSRAKWCL